MENKNYNSDTCVKYSFWSIVKESFMVFCGIQKEDEGKRAAKEVAKTVSKGVAYYFSDYGFTVLTVVIVGISKWLGFNDFQTTIFVWVYDVLTAYGFVLFSRNIIEDFTLTESMRKSIGVIRKKSKVTAFFLAAILLIRFSIWDGPERVAIFFKKELKNRAEELLLIAIFSILQAAFWTKLYLLGIDGLSDVFKLIFK
jgi:hypothetical protein